MLPVIWLCWLLLACVLRWSRLGDLRKRRFVQVAKARHSQRLRGYIQSRRIELVQLGLVSLFQLCGLIFMPSIILGAPRQNVMTLLAWHCCHYLACCLVLPMESVHVALASSCRSLSSFSRGMLQRRTAHLALAGCAAASPTMGRLLGVIVTLTLICDADPTHALQSRIVTQMFRAVPCHLLFASLTFWLHAGDPIIASTWLALCAVPPGLLLIFRVFTRVRTELDVVVLYDEPLQLRDFAFAFRPGYLCNTHGLGLLQKHFLRTSLRARGFALIDLGRKGWQEALCEAVSTLTADNQVHKSRVVPFCSGGRVYAAWLPLPAHFCVCITVGCLQLPLRIMHWLFHQMQWFEDRGARFQSSARGTHLLHRVHPRGSVAGALLLVVVSALQTNFLFDTSRLERSVELAFGSLDISTIESWILACTWRGAAQLLLILLGTRSVMMMTDLAQIHDAERTGVPTSVWAELPCELNHAWCHLARIEASMRLVHVQQLLRLHCLDARVLFDFEDSSVTDLEHSTLRLTQAVWAVSAVVQVPRGSLEQALCILQEYRLPGAGHLLAFELQSVQRLAPLVLSGCSQLILVEEVLLLAMPDTLSYLLSKALKRQLDHGKSVSTTLLQGRGSWGTAQEDASLIRRHLPPDQSSRGQDESKSIKADSLSPTQLGVACANWQATQLNCKHLVLGLGILSLLLYALANVTLALIVVASVLRLAAGAGTGKAVKIETSKPYVDDTTWKASRPEEVKRDFEFWDQGDYLDIKAVMLLRVVLARLFMWISLVIEWLVHLTPVQSFLAMLSRVNTEPSDMVETRRLKSGWIPNALAEVAPVSILPFAIAYPDPEFKPYIGGTLVQDSDPDFDMQPDLLSWSNGYVSYASMEDLNSVWCRRIQHALSKAGYVIDPTYRRRLARNPYITETITRQQSEWLRTFGAVQGMNTADVLPLLYEDFSMKRYARPAPDHSATTQDAIRVADALYKKFGASLKGHTVKTPARVLAERKKYVSPGFFMEGAHLPGGYDGDDSLHSFMTPVDLERWFSVCQARYCVPTSRNWKSHHEAMRSHIESCFMDDARFKLATKHLRRLRAEWRTLGPEARRFLKARPVPDRNKVLRRFYLSSKAAPIQAESSDSIHSFVPIWEARLNWGLASGLAALRQLAAERLAAERLSLSARDALYVQEAVTEHHVYLSTAPETMLVFEQRCAASIFGTVTRPAEFWARIQHKAPAVWERPFWAGKAQLLTWVTLLLGLLQRFLARQRIIGVFVRLYALLTSGSAGFWSAISILAFLGPGQIDPRTSNLVLKVEGSLATNHKILELARQGGSAGRHRDNDPAPGSLLLEGRILTVSSRELVCDKQTDIMAAAMTAEVRGVIETFLAKAKAGTLVQSVNALHDFLLKQKLAWSLKLSCEFIGVHPENRDGLGISASHVSDLISNIASIGYSSAEARAICIEIPEDSRGDACRDFNCRLAEEANGKLAPVQAHLVKYASVVGSHANQACRAFLHGIPHDDQKVTIDGRLSLDKLHVLDPSWCSAIREGMQWMVISHQVCEAFPDYVGLAQSAGNAAAQIASGEGELQLARKVNQAIQEFMSRTGKDTVTYSDVAPGILRSKPPSGSSLPGIFTFVLRYGGGAAHDSFLSRSEKHIRAHGHAARSLGADFWSALSTECKGTTNQRVLFRHMILKLAFCGPEKLLNLADVRRSMTAKDILGKADEAESLMKRMKQLLSSDDRLTPEVASATLSEVEMELVAVIFQKKKFTSRVSLEQVCHEALRKYDDAGAPVNNARVVELGFDKGVQVIRKADEVVAVVEEIQPDKVTLKLASDGSLGKWKKHTDKSQPIQVGEWWESSPCASPDFLISTVKGRVMLSMLQQYEAFKHEKALQIFSKPREVKSLKAFAVGALQVPICTNRVDIRPSSQAGSQGAILIGSMKGAGADMSVYIVPSVTFPKDGNIGFISPAWCMKASCDKEECNCEVSAP
ncbi:unnamed protein product, partial [Symbiodinium microadriaticum]